MQKSTKKAQHPSHTRNYVFEFRADDPNDDTGDVVEEHGAETGTDGKKGKTPRVRLTLEEKIMLVLHSRENPLLTHKELIVWSQKQFAGTETSQLTLSMKTNRKPKITERRSRESAQEVVVAKANTWLVRATLQVGRNIGNVLADRKKWQDALPAIYIAYPCSQVSELLHPGAVQVEILVHAQSGRSISQAEGMVGIKEIECMPILPGKRNHKTVLG
jgi:hypothetical protein